MHAKRVCRKEPREMRDLKLSVPLDELESQVREWRRQLLMSRWEHFRYRWLQRPSWRIGVLNNVIEVVQYARSKGAN